MKKAKYCLALPFPFLCLSSCLAFYCCFRRNPGFWYEPAYLEHFVCFHPLLFLALFLEMSFWLHVIAETQGMYTLLTTYVSISKLLLQPGIQEPSTKECKLTATIVCATTIPTIERQW